MTVDTNLITLLTNIDHPTTTLHTELNTHSGELTVAVSAPLLGQHNIQLRRHSQPAPTTP
ncbi:hypothetical protein GZH49_33085 [Nocardia terpenica]|uniref:hypothetical protein n=1 Tax=Nocardia terpenica TaxID=455432 RepID=UPI002FE3A3E3